MDAEKGDYLGRTKPGNADSYVGRDRSELTRCVRCNRLWDQEAAKGWLNYVTVNGIYDEDSYARYRGVCGDCSR